MGSIRCFGCVIALVAFAAAIDQADALHPVEAATLGYSTVILRTVDTTRADRMGFLGSTKGLTPSLDALAKESAVFPHAYSQAPLTPTSHTTILSGTYPQY